MASLGCEELIMRTNSSRIRSFEIFANCPAHCFIASLVFSSIEKPSSAEIRIARIMRRASSAKRSFGSPTARIIPAEVSFMPPYRSRSCSETGLYANAFTLKSRRFRSSSIFCPNSTLSGRRASLYFLPFQSIWRCLNYFKSFILYTFVYDPDSTKFVGIKRIFK